MKVNDWLEKVPGKVRRHIIWELFFKLHPSIRSNEVEIEKIPENVRPNVLDKRIARSRFLEGTKSLKWIIKNYDRIYDGDFEEFEEYYGACNLGPITRSFVDVANYSNGKLSHNRTLKITPIFHCCIDLNSQYLKKEVLEIVLKQGSNYLGSKCRIKKCIETESSIDVITEFVKNEYGVSGFDYGKCYMTTSPDGIVYGIRGLFEEFISWHSASCEIKHLIEDKRYFGLSDNVSLCFTF